MLHFVFYITYYIAIPLPDCRLHMWGLSPGFHLSPAWRGNCATIKSHIFNVHPGEVIASQSKAIFFNVYLFSPLSCSLSLFKFHEAPFNLLDCLDLIIISSWFCHLYLAETGGCKHRLHRLCLAFWHLCRWLPLRPQDVCL